MRILALRGRNLASLADGFEVDLQAEPLASAGLFAITGDTGAGKSTLLDAMVLALYGACPRLRSAGGNDAVPDAAGEAINATDPRSCLRRGAAEGFAEADFIGIDGIAYRARWEVRRARGRANGTLQADQRALSNLATGTMLETGKRAVAEAIPRLTGLTFEQFCRTVLLAQGDFDAFLRANDAERAELLEKITGTEIYRTISQRVYECAAAQVTDLTRLEDRRAAIGLKTDAERQALLDRMAALNETGRREAQARAAIEAEIARFVAIERAEALQSEAASGLAQAIADAEPLAGLRLRRAELQRIEPLRPSMEAADRAGAALAETEAQAAQAAIQVQSSAETAARDRLAWAATAAAQAAAQARFKTLGPIYDQAAKLDTEILSAETEHRAALADRAQATAAADAAGAALTAIQSQIAEFQTRQIQAEAIRDQLLPSRPIFERWGEIDTQLQASIRLRAAESEEVPRQKRAEAALAAAARDIAGLDLADTAAAGVKLALDQEIASVQSLLAAIDEPGLAQAQTGLALLDRKLGDLAASVASHRHALTEHAAALIQEDAAARQIAAAEAARQSAEQAGIAAASARDALRAPLDLAESQVEASARHLRARLVDGEPCPVCGATDHPLRESDAALIDLAQAMRTQYQDAITRLDAAARDLAAARGALAEANADRAAAIRRGAAATDLRETALTGYRDHQAAALALGAALGLVWPESAEPNAGPEAAGLLDQKRRATEAALAEARHQRVALDRLRQAADDWRAAADDRTRRRALANQALLTASTALATATERLALITAERQRIDRDLAQVLEAAEIPIPDLGEAPESLRRQLTNLVEAHDANDRMLLALDQKLRRVELALTAAQGQAEHARIGYTNAVAIEAQRAAVLADRRRDRAALLDGEATGSHRSRSNAERLSAEAAHQAAQDRLNASDAAVAIAVSRRDDLLAEQQRRAQARDRCAAEFAAALADQGRSEPDARHWLGIGRDERAMLETTIRAADRAIADAEATLKARVADLAIAQANGIPETSRADLHEMADRSRQAHDLRLAELGAIRAEIAIDNQARLSAAGLGAEIEAKRATVAIWQAVNQAIGSQNGAKFQKFAQGQTLSLLVELANHHLASLKPRYRLTRGLGGDLGLHVIDRDMGDERRSTRSLSGGERFLVSLALALALSGLEGRQSLVDTLFIDEGFGSLDEESLDVAVDALETLQSQGRKVGVISHVAALKDRIPVQIRVEKQGGGRSRVAVEGWTS